MIPYKKITLLSCLLLFLPACFLMAQVSHKSVLLDKIKRLPMPDKADMVGVVFTTAVQAEVLAVTESYEEVNMQCPVMACSTLDQGRLFVLGSPAYFKAAMIQNQDVAQLMKNILKWAKGTDRRKLKVALMTQPDAAFSKLLKSAGADVYHHKGFKLEPHTRVVFLDKDITDSLQRQALEVFIRRGGTLVLASTYGGQYKQRVKDKPYLMKPMAMNTLLLKGGLFNENILLASSAEHQYLVTAQVPEYLQLRTILEGYKQGGGKQWDKNQWDLLARPMIDLMFAHNEIGSPTLNHVKAMFSLADYFSAPSPKNPVSIATETEKSAYQMGYWFGWKQQGGTSKQPLIAPTANQFPGSVPAETPRLQYEKVSIPVRVGKQGLLEMPTVFYRMHSTGLYIAPGDTVKINMDSKYLDQHLKAQIGVHEDNLMHLDVLARHGENLTRIFELDKETTAIYSPHGGLLMINIGDTCTLKNITIEVSGAIKAARFKLGETKADEWRNTIRHVAAPWAELATDKLILTVPASRIRNLDHPEKLMQFWDEVMDADADLAIIPRERLYPERIIIDKQAPFGYMCTFPAKIITPDDDSCVLMLDEKQLRKNGSWGHFHELGHRHQFWGIDFPAQSEVTVNLYTMYIYDKVLKKGIYHHEEIPDRLTNHEKIKAYLASDPDLEKWTKNPFDGLRMYIQLIDHFGWQAIISLHKIYRGLPEKDYPASEQDKIDFFFLSLCRATGSNLYDFFTAWKIPVSTTVAEKVKVLPAWVWENG